MKRSDRHIRAMEPRLYRAALDLIASGSFAKLSLRDVATESGIAGEAVARLHPCPQALAKRAVMRAMIDMACCLRAYRASRSSLEQAVADYSAFLAMVFGSSRYRRLRAIVDKEGKQYPWIAAAHLQCVIEPAACNLLTVLRRVEGGGDGPLFMQRSELVRILAFVERRALAQPVTSDRSDLASISRQAVDYVRASLDSFAFIRSPAPAAIPAFAFLQSASRPGPGFQPPYR
jgi:hypothetical protein